MKSVISENLKRLRREKSAKENRLVSQRDVGVAIGKDPNTIRNYESGATCPDFETAWLLADFYGTTIDALGGRYTPDTPAVVGR